MQLPLARLKLHNRFFAVGQIVLVWMVVGNGQFGVVPRDVRQMSAVARPTIGDAMQRMDGGGKRQPRGTKVQGSGTIASCDNPPTPSKESECDV